MKKAHRAMPMLFALHHSRPARMFCEISLRAVQNHCCTALSQICHAECQMYPCAGGSVYDGIHATREGRGARLLDVCDGVVVGADGVGDVAVRRRHELVGGLGLGVAARRRELCAKRVPRVVAICEASEELPCWSYGQYPTGNGFLYNTPS
eukprot:6214791-Pleurochrysis_carterae.AAC.8